MRQLRRPTKPDPSSPGMFTFTGMFTVDSIACSLRQKLANLIADSGFGRNDQRGAATSRRPRAEMTRPCAETSIYQFRRVGLSASWIVGELSSYRRSGNLTGAGANADSTRIEAPQVWGGEGEAGVWEGRGCAPVGELDCRLSPSPEFFFLNSWS